MKKIEFKLLIILSFLLAGCTDSLTTHEKLSSEATTLFLNDLQSIDLCFAIRAGYKKLGYRSGRIKYKLCGENIMQEVFAPHTSLKYSLKVSNGFVKIDVTNGDLENFDYSDFQEYYLNQENGEIKDVLLVVKSDINKRRRIASSNGIPIKELDSLTFTLDSQDKDLLNSRMTAHTCNDSSTCVQ